MKKVEKNSKVSLYAQIYDILVKEIENEKWCPGDFFPTISELSEEFNVSIITVKRVISELSKNGYLETSQGVRSRIANKIHQNNNKSFDSNIAVLFYSKEKNKFSFAEKGPWTGTIVSAVQDTLIDNLYLTTLVPLQTEGDFEGFMKDKITSFCGVICIGGKFSKNLKELKNTSVPFVVVGRPDADIKSNYIAADYYQGSSLAAKTLILHNAASFVLLKTAGSYANTLLMRGFQETLLDSGVDYERIFIINLDNIMEESSRKALLKYFNSKKPNFPIGIFASGAFLADGAISACKEYNLEINKDAFIVSSDINVCPSSDIMSKIINPAKKCGEKAAEILSSMIKNNTSEFPGVELPMELS